MMQSHIINGYAKVFWALWNPVVWSIVNVFWKCSLSLKPYCSADQRQLWNDCCLETVHYPLLVWRNGLIAYVAYCCFVLSWCPITLHCILCFILASLYVKPFIPLILTVNLQRLGVTSPVAGCIPIHHLSSELMTILDYRVFWLGTIKYSSLFALLFIPFSNSPWNFLRAADAAAVELCFISCGLLEETFLNWQNQ